MAEDWARAWQPRDRDFAGKVRMSFERHGAMSTIGAELVSVTAGECCIRLPYSPGVSQQPGHFHGGLVATIADSAGAFAAFSLCPPHRDVFTVEYKVNFIAPASGVALLATGRVLKPGRTLIVCRIDVQVEALDGTRAPCAILQQTVMTAPAGKGSVLPLKL